MAGATAARELKLVRDADGLELDTQPLQGLWTAQQYLKLTEQTNHLVVSPDNPERDTQEKRGDYAEAGIPEYWIVNPLDETITVLTLRGAAYIEHGVFRRGARATSVLLPGFAVSVAAVFDVD